MTQEEKDLPLKDSCARLPYNPFCDIGIGHPVPMKRILVDKVDGVLLDFYDNGKNYQLYLSEVKPYLRPMSSMTEEEVNEYNQYWEKDRDDIMIVGKHFEEMYKSKKFTLYMHPVVPMYRHILWLLENHFDFMGLIPKGLAIEVTKENNPYK